MITRWESSRPQIYTDERGSELNHKNTRPYSSDLRLSAQICGSDLSFQTSQSGDLKDPPTRS